MIKVMAEVGLPKKAFDIYSDMNAKGFTPTPAIFESLLNSCGLKEEGSFPKHENNDDRIDVALQVLVEMMLKKVQVDRALALFFSFIAHEVKREKRSTTKNTTDNNNTRNPSTPAVSLVTFMHSQGLMLAESYLHQVDALCCASKNLVGGQFLIKVMHERGLQPSESLVALTQASL